MDDDFHHRPVMAAEVVELLAAVPTGLVVDATVGGGGHARALLDRPARPPAPRHRPGSRRRGSGGRGARALRGRVRIVQGGFERRRRHRREADIVGNEGIVGILFDLGVSSPQLDRPVRGFSYWADAAPLDMRMDSAQTLTAATVVNEYSEADLAALIARNGEERYARRIAAEIVAARPLRTTGELVEAVKRGIPAAARRRGGHPRASHVPGDPHGGQPRAAEPRRRARRVGAPARPEGRMLVLAYHSLEDRMVKERFADWSRTEEPGLRADGPPARRRATRSPRLLTRRAAAAVGGRGRGEPARRERPPARGRAPRAVTTVAAPARRAPPARRRRPRAPRSARAARVTRDAAVAAASAASGAVGDASSRSSPCSRS